MKKSLLALAALGAFAGAAQAQSSVTLYGVADMNLEYVNHLGVAPSAANGLSTGRGNSVYRMSSGGLSGSRWGLRGVEDLGGGLKALFVLESGFALDTGSLQQGGRLFGRQAYVGIESAQAGRFTFGRQYTTLFDLLANFSPSGYATQYEPVVAQLGLNFRSDNTAKYTGVFGPVTAIAHWSFGNGVAGNGEVPGQFRRDTGYGAGVAYAAGPFGATVAYDQYNPTLSATGDTGTFKKAAVAGSYAFGPAKIMGGYRWGQAKAQNGAPILRDNYYWIGANYQVTAPLGLTLQYNYDDVKNFGGNTHLANPWQVSFIADYSLSKRTDVYLTAAYAKNAGLNFDTSAISFANGYFLGSNNDNMLGVGVGIRHKF
ncbi:porin [Cupriavidus sp. CuC1]|uniref:porin n=1 Tax=Cupriavidus TaxID=106589 RepID=UPI00296B16A4|nr:porin [Cupriavidus sp. CV2]MDW3680345.1 porin [Cupriavidus sp. CV2]